MIDKRTKHHVDSDHPQLLRRPAGHVGEGNGTPIQYSCLENPMDRGAWWAIVPGISKSQTQLKQLSMHACNITANQEGYSEAT